MSRQIAGERRHVVFKSGTNLRKPSVPIPCVAKTLYDSPPQSKFFPLQLFYNLMHLTFVCLSKFVHGQHLITFFDYYMYKLELTIDYCVPRGWRDNEVPATPLRALADADRPLTWVLFIPTLIWLRVVRFWLSALSIVMGKGEVTAKHMRTKVVDFRRYYRSIRHYAVRRYSPIELLLKKTRCSYSRYWAMAYAVYEYFVMTKPLVEHHSNMPREEQNKESNEETDKSVNNFNGRKQVKKSCLNEIDGDDSSDNELCTKELLDKYEKAKDSQADPDYAPLSSEDLSSEEISSEADTEEEKTESQKKLNDESFESRSEAQQVNGCQSDVEKSKKSKKEKEKSFTMDQEQLIELENQLVMKMLKHFKENYNYSPVETEKNSEDVFYSPIGSPPERNCASDSDVYPSSIEVVLDQQIPEVSSTQNTTTDADHASDQVASQSN